MACPMIIFHMFSVMRGADFLVGLRFRIFRVGGSVASASAAKVSIIKFTQRSWTAVRTDSSVEEATAEMKVRRTAVMFTVSWNWENFSLV